MRVLAIVHQDDAGLGVFEDVLRDRGADVERWSPPDGTPAPALGGFEAVIALGGDADPDQRAAHAWIEEEVAVLAGLLRLEVAVLGVCLGAQLLAAAAGAAPRRAGTPEIGWLPVDVTPGGALDPLLGPLAPRFEAFEWHSFEFPLPAGAIPLARSAACLQSYRIGSRAWGIQFHAEVTASDAESWTAAWRSDPDAVRTGLDPEALRAGTAGRIEAWNELGRGLCGRFLDAARRGP